MAYNIDTVTTLGEHTLTMDAEALDAFPKNDKLPETNFVSELRRLAANERMCPSGHGVKIGRFCDFCGKKVTAPKSLPIERVSWIGDGSGHTFDTFKDALRKTRGRAELVLTWEGGDTHSGLLVEDGVVTECDVQFKLVPKS